MRSTKRGRPQTWDREAVLDAAMQAFRRKGHAQTSVRDLGEATGLHTGSLYAAFGSKDGLFAAAVAHYNVRVVATRIQTHLQADDPVAGVESLFRSAFAVDAGPQLGCLITNSAIEAPVLSGSAADGVHEGVERLRAALVTAIARGQQSGHVRADASPGSLAAQVVALYHGTLVLVRLGRPAAELDALTRGALTSILRPHQGATPCPPPR